MPFNGILYQDDEILRVLRAAQERIRKPENWCQGYLERVTLDGTEQWCARGAVIAETGYNSDADVLLNRAAVETGYVDHHGPKHAVVALNNTTDHPTVMLMFSRAIELRQAEILAVAPACWEDGPREGIWPRDCGTPTDRRNHIATLCEMVANFTAEAEGHEEDETLYEAAQAELWRRRAYAIIFALGFVEQHVSLQTGKLTISLEPEEVAS